MSNATTKELRITMPDTSVWAVPVSIIATNRAEYYAKKFGGVNRPGFYRHFFAS
jgi:hypothetical protein